MSNRRLSRDQRRRAKLARRYTYEAPVEMQHDAQPIQPRDPLWDEELPRTEPEILAAMSAAKLQALREGRPDGSIVLSGPAGGGGGTRLSSSMSLLFRLQAQLFRVVFGREMDKTDPVFWDRAREKEGVFRIDRAAQVTAEGLPKAVAYAAVVTGRLVTPDAWDELSEGEQEEWNDAVDDYTGQIEAGGLPPLAPEQLIAAMFKVHEVFSGMPPAVVVGQAAAADRTRMALTVLGELLGSDELAIAAMNRVAVLKSHVVRVLPEIAIETGVLEGAAVAAAAGAFIDATTMKFDMDDFMERLVEARAVPAREEALQ